MMDFTITDVVYMAMAVRSILEHDLCKADRDAYEKLWYKLKISHKGKKVRETFDDGWKVYVEGKKDKAPCKATTDDFLSHYRETGESLCARYGDLYAEDVCHKCPWRER